jgi:membrane-bound lytic murein transglycosylase F
MQIMPATADHLGLPRNMIYEPEANIAASAKFLQELASKFGDIQDPSQRCYYVLACYNGGYHHVRDAMKLTKKYGRNPYNWGDVAEFILKLRMPAYYNDPLVQYGYMRGDETVDYVDRIRQRWAQYRGVGRGGSVSPMGNFSSGMIPKRAEHRYHYKVE